MQKNHPEWLVQHPEWLAEQEARLAELSPEPPSSPAFPPSSPESIVDHEWVRNLRARRGAAATAVGTAAADPEQHQTADHDGTKPGERGAQTADDGPEAGEQQPDKQQTADHDDGPAV